MELWRVVLMVSVLVVISILQHAIDSSFDAEADHESSSNTDL
jgi:hypothetical protein